MNFLQSILEIALFLVAILSCFYLPGKLLINKLKLKLNSPEDLFFPFSIGLIIFTLIAYILSWLKLGILIPLFVLIIDFIALKSKKCLPDKIEKNHFKILSLVVFLAVIFSLSMVLAGVFRGGVSWRRDDSWHLALINELKAHFPPDNPGFAGVPLKGYHYFYNFVLAKISQIFKISPLSLYFHFFPLFTALLWGVGVYSLMYRWSKDKRTALWAVFLTFFGGSFSFILRLQGHMGLSLDSAFGILQSASSLVNPPFAISIVIVITTLFSLYQYLSTRQNNWLIPVILCIGSVTMFKVYAGMILLGSFMFLTFIDFFKKRFILIGALLAIGILFLGTYWILADRSASLIFQPLWPARKMLQDNMPWYGYTEKHYTYSRLSVIRGLIKIEAYGLFVFIIGNLGTRVIGLLSSLVLLVKKRKSPSLFTLTVFIMLAISLLIPLFFIQTGKVFEIIQMAWYFLFFSSLFASFGFTALFKFKGSKMFKVLLLLIILIVTLPSAYEQCRGYLGLSKPRRSLSEPYFKAMEFLESQGTYDSIVLEIPNEQFAPIERDLMNWYGGSSAAIVGFSNKRSYLNNQFIDFPGVDIKPRINFLQKILLLNKTLPTVPEYKQLQKEVKGELLENKISFIYSPYPLSCFEGIENIRQVYQNQGVTIYQVYEN